MLSHELLTDISRLTPAGRQQLMRNALFVYRFLSGQNKPRKRKHDGDVGRVK